MILVRRFDGRKAPVPIGAAVREVTAALEADQRALLDTARAHREARTVDVQTLDEAVDAARAGWARLPWSAVGPQGEDRLNAEGLTVRCLLRTDGGLPDDGDEAELLALVARAY